MASKKGLQLLARRLIAPKQSLPVRGGGGGPVKLESAPDKPLPLWAELQSNDGQLHTEPALEFTAGHKPFWPKEQAAVALFTALGIMGAAIYSAFATWTPSKAVYTHMQYPPEVMETFTTGKKA